MTRWRPRAPEDLPEGELCIQAEPAASRTICGKMVIDPAG